MSLEITAVVAGTASAQSRRTQLSNDQKVPKGALNYLKPVLFSTNTKLHCLNKIVSGLLYFIPIFLSLGFWQKALRWNGFGHQPTKPSSVDDCGIFLEPGMNRLSWRWQFRVVEVFAAVQAWNTDCSLPCHTSTDYIALTVSRKCAFNSCCYRGPTRYIKTWHYVQL